MNALLEEDIRNGNALAPGETIVWTGKPSWRRVARDALHLRGISSYFGLLFVLDAYQAWTKAIPLQPALHDSVPLVAITVLALAILTTIAGLIGRSRYTITNRRVILRYGLALPATLSIPMSQIASTAVAEKNDGTADIALVLKAGNRMPYLKLWPHARAWHVTEPQPMLRALAQGAAVATTLARTLQAAEGGRIAPAPRRKVEEQELVPQLLGA